MEGYRLASVKAPDWDPKWPETWRCCELTGAGQHYVDLVNCRLEFLEQYQCPPALPPRGCLNYENIYPQGYVSLDPRTWGSHG